MKRLCFVIGALVTLVAPREIRAQGIGAASIVGVVRDTSGAVLPGVTVEAASPVLIEKVRTTVTDAEGRYQIAELRPGTYSVTFTLPGFTTFKRDGLELSPNFVATVNADLRVGELAETDRRLRADAARRRRAACRRERSSARRRWRCCRRARASAECWRSCPAPCHRPTASTPAGPRASSRSASRSSAPGRATCVR